MMDILVVINNINLVIWNSSIYKNIDLSSKLILLNKIYNN
jgi:hypothetical protein